MVFTYFSLFGDHQKGRIMFYFFNNFEKNLIWKYKLWGRGSKLELKYNKVPIFGYLKQSNDINIFQLW